MTHNTSKFQVGGGLESADIGVLVRGVKNENFPCPARLRALNSYPDGRVNLLDIIVFHVFFLDSDSLVPIGPPSPGLIFHDGSDAV